MERYCPRVVWLRRCLQAITCEPVALLISIHNQFSLVEALQMFYIRCYEIFQPKLPQNVNMQTFCVHDIYGANDTKMVTIEKSITLINMCTTIGTTVAMLAATPIINSLSDTKLGRKRPMVVCLLGWLVDSLVNLYIVYDYGSYDNILMLAIPLYTLTTLTGSYAVFGNMTITMVIDNLRHREESESTSFRLSILYGAQAVGGLIGTAITVILQHTFTEPAYYMFVEVVAYARLLVAAMALVYGVFCVPETHFPTRTESDGCSLKRMATTILDGYKQTILVIIRPRVGWDRFCLIFSLVFTFGEYLQTVMGTLYLLVRLPPFSFADATLTELVTVGTIFQLIGVFLVPALFRHIDHRITVVILIAVGAHIVGGVAFGVVWQGWQVFAAYSIHMFLTGPYKPTLTAFTFEFVEEDEAARVCGFSTTLDVIIPVIQSALFNMIYRWSLSWYPGFYFILYAIAFVFIFFGQSVVHTLYWKQRRRPDEYRPLM